MKRVLRYFEYVFGVAADGVGSCLSLVSDVALNAKAQNKGGNTNAKAASQSAGAGSSRWDQKDFQVSPGNPGEMQHCHLPPGAYTTLNVARQNANQSLDLYLTWQVNIGS